jgi:hypothetical protein
MQTGTLLLTGTITGCFIEIAQNKADDWSTYHISVLAYVPVIITIIMKLGTGFSGF